MTRLIIENTEVELDESVQFAITKQFEDLSNPTTIINSWSKTVSIPFTQRNNNLFGHIYNTDRLIAEGGTSITGIYFNPYKKLDFRLQWGDSVLMVGYAKMNEVKQNNGKGTYEITLFGELGKIFQELKKITFDKTAEDANYIICGSTWVEENIDRNLVSSSWNSSGQTHESLENKYTYYINPTTGDRRKVPNPQYRVTDIIGFAPNNSYSNDFDYKSIQASNKTIRSFTDMLGTGFTQDTGVDADIVIKDGLTPRGWGEYRSYLQLPFIYWNKLFKIFESKAEIVTGYQFELDNTWFNTSNPYWYNLVYMLKTFNTKKSEGATNYYPFYYEEGNIRWAARTINWSGNKITNIGSYETTETVPLINGYRVVPARFTTSDNYSLLCNLFLNLQLNVQTNGSPIKLANNNGLAITVNLINGSNTVIKNYKILYCNSNFSYVASNYDEVIKYDDAATTTTSSSYDSFIISSNLHFNIMKNDFADSVGFQLNAHWINSNVPFVSNGGSYNPQNYATILYPNMNQSLSVQIDNRIKSNAKFTLNDLWDNEYNLFDEIIKYCKMYRISISIDEINKKIRFKSFNKYFESYTVEDWTNKVDKSKDFKIVPISFEDKYVLFNCKDSETQLSKEYKEKYSVNYGDYRLITEYNFNNNTKNLFEKVNQSITNTDNVLSWINLFAHRIVYSLPSEISVYNKNKDNKQVDIFGSMFFHNGLANFNTESALNLTSANISDDSEYQRNNNLYCFTSIQTDRTYITTFPLLDIVNGDNMCVFSSPMENYTYLNNYSGKNGIYKNLWEKYINERYNIQNKKITCYVNLSPSDYIQFDWNHFVKIGNQLCIVNKIYDYDVSSKQPTKVDLITVQDISGYTTNNY